MQLRRWWLGHRWRWLEQWWRWELLWRGRRWVCVFRKVFTRKLPVRVGLLPPTPQVLLLLLHRIVPANYRILAAPLVPATAGSWWCPDQGKRPRT